MKENLKFFVNSCNSGSRQMSTLAILTVTTRYRTIKVPGPANSNHRYKINGKQIYCKLSGRPVCNATFRKNNNTKLITIAKKHPKHSYYLSCRPFSDFFSQFKPITSHSFLSSLIVSISILITGFSATKNRQIHSRKIVNWT